MTKRCTILAGSNNSKIPNINVINFLTSKLKSDGNFKLSVHTTRGMFIVYRLLHREIGLTEKMANVLFMRIICKIKLFQIPMTPSNEII